MRCWVWLLGEGEVELKGGSGDEVSKIVIPLVYCDSDGNARSEDSGLWFIFLRFSCGGRGLEFAFRLVVFSPEL